MAKVQNKTEAPITLSAKVPGGKGEPATPKSVTIPGGKIVGDAVEAGEAVEVDDKLLELMRQNKAIAGFFAEKKLAILK